MSNVLSVLLAVRNGERTVAAAIESIRAQTWTDWELIVVNDASTDGTAAVLARFTDPRIHVLRNDVNRGLAASLNLAFRASHGALIARMDADDVALPERFERQFAFLAGHPDVDVLGTAAFLVDGHGRDLGTSTRSETHDAIAASILKLNPFIHPSVMMRRHVLEQLGGYDESLLRVQDYDLWLRGLAKRFRYHNLQEPLLRYRAPDRSTWISSSYAARVIWKNAGWRGTWYAARMLAAWAISKLR